MIAMVVEEKGVHLVMVLGKAVIGTILILHIHLLHALIAMVEDMLDVLRVMAKDPSGVACVLVEDMTIALGVMAMAALNVRPAMAMAN